MNSVELYNLSDRNIRSSKQRRKLRELKQLERDARRQRMESRDDIASVNKRPSYQVPKRNQHLNISKQPRHTPVVVENKELSEEMMERELIALAEIERKKLCVAPAFNKGAYTYIASEEQAKWVGKK